MKRLWLVSLFLLSCALTAAAQEDTTLLEEEMPPPRHGLVGGGAGAVPTFLFLRLNDLNASLAQGQLPALNGSGIFLMGGGGYFYTGFIRNLRIGGVGAGGSITNASDVVMNGVTKTTKLSMSYWGVSLEYVIPFGDFHVAAGGVLGGGSMTLTLTSNVTSVDWNELVKMFGDRTFTNLMRHQLSRGYFAYQPTISLEYVPHPLISVRLTGGYYGMNNGGWTLNDDTPVTGAPALKIAGSFLQLGIFVGAFLSN